jgi:hypothetical protein
VWQYGVLKSMHLGGEKEPAGNGPESLGLRKIAKSLSKSNLMF